MSKHETVKILRYNSDGAGVGTLASGKTVFVPFTAAGETVEISVVQEQKNYAIAETVKIIEASPDRVSPRCPVFGKCGGCQLMHISYEKQLEIKRDILRGALKRIGGIDFEPEAAAPSTPFCYRNKAALFKAQAGGKTSAGFYASNSHDIVDIEYCPICGDWLTKIISDFRAKNAAGDCVTARRIGGRVQCAFGDRNAALSGGERLNGECAGIKYSVDINSFLQVNPDVAETMYLKALELSGVNENDIVIDAYSGIGILTALFARRAKKAYGIEIVPQAVADANRLMLENGITNAENILADCGRELPRLLNHSAVGRLIIILDPPRKGCDRAVVDALIQYPADKIIYISCDPATLSRDLKLLTAGNIYKLTYARPFDMFPQTSNIEALICLEKI